MCSSLTDVVIPNSVEKIDGYAFQGCKSLTGIVIPVSVSELGAYAFCWGDSLASAVIPEGVTKLYAVFEGCDNLKDIFYSGTKAQWEQIETDSDGWREIRAAIHCSDGEINIGTCDQNAGWELMSDGRLHIKGSGEMDDFYCSYSGENYDIIEIDYPWKDYCDVITHVEIDSGITSIGDNAFNQCTALKTVIIPDTVTRIGEQAFSYSAVTELTLPVNVKRIGRRAFSFCEKLEKINIPDGVTDISDCFAFCKNLKEIELPYGIAEIPADTFRWCSGMTDIEIPDSVTKIGSKAFHGCESLKTVYYSGTEEQWNKIIIEDFNTDLTSAQIIYNS